MRAIACIAPLLALVCAGCSIFGGTKEVPIPVDNQACTVFEPYRRSVAHLDKPDRIFIRQHNAGGRALCKKHELWNGDYYR